MRLLFTLIFCLCIYALSGQSIIKGLVIDNNGQPVAGASILCTGNNNGTVSNNDGLFTLSSSILCKELSISMAGYLRKDLIITKVDSFYKVILEQIDKTLSEVVVVSVRSSGKRKTIKGKPSIIKTAAIDGNENPFKNATCEPVSTFGADVDKASYSYIRRKIQEGLPVPRDLVKIEEMVNYFDYNYNNTDTKTPYTIYPELTTCPWNAEHQLMKVALKANTQEKEKELSANYVFLIDVSGSMSTEDRLPLVKASLKLLLDSLSLHDKIAIVTYAGKSGVALESTSVADKKTILKALDELTSGGSTAGSEGIKLAYETAEDHFVEGGNNRVILATDGDFNVGVTNYKELENLIDTKKQSGIFLTCLGFGTNNYKDQTMESLADKGNGNYYYIDNIEEAKRVLQKDFRGTINTVAKDVKIQVEFNNKYVQLYRLLGYENRVMEKEDFDNDAKDGGEIGEGHTVTVLYEIVPTKGIRENSTKNIEKCSPVLFNDESNDLAIIRTRYKNPNSNRSKKLDYFIINNPIAFEKATSNTKWAAAVAMYAMYLQGSKYMGTTSLNRILEITKPLESSKDALQLEFINLVKLTK